jgi:hypothetical protein
VSWFTNTVCARLLTVILCRISTDSRHSFRNRPVRLYCEAPRLPAHSFAQPPRAARRGRPSRQLLVAGSRRLEQFAAGRASRPDRVGLRASAAFAQRARSRPGPRRSARRGRASRAVAHAAYRFSARARRQRRRRGRRADSRSSSRSSAEIPPRRSRPLVQFELFVIGVAWAGVPSGSWSSARVASGALVLAWRGTALRISRRSSLASRGRACRRESSRQRLAAPRASDVAHFVSRIDHG